MELPDCALLVDEVIDLAQHDAQRQYLAIHRNRYVFTLFELAACLPAARFLDIGSSGMFPGIMKKICEGIEACGTVHSEKPGIERKMAPFSWGEHEFEMFLGNPEKHSYQIPDQTFDLVLCAEVIEHMAHDPMALLSEINRVMTLGGRVVITTPNIVSARSIMQALNHEMPYNFFAFNRDGSNDRHNIEYSPGLLARLAEAAGFEVIDLKTVNCWSLPDKRIEALFQLLGFREDLRGDDIVMALAKAGNVRDRYPEFLYI